MNCVRGTIIWCGDTTILGYRTHRDTGTQLTREQETLKACRCNRRKLVTRATNLAGGIVRVIKNSFRKHSSEEFGESVYLKQPDKVAPIRYSREVNNDIKQGYSLDCASLYWI